MHLMLGMFGRRGRAIIAAGAVAIVGTLFAAPGADAQTASTCGYGTGGPFASNLCWFNMAGYSDATARSAEGQEMEITLPGGYTASFTVTSRPVAGATTHPTVAGRSTPLEQRFAFGSSGADGGYRGVPGSPALYSQPAAGSLKGVALTLSDIEVTDSAGQPVTGYRFVIADAENNVAGENFAWTSDKPLELIGVLNDDAPAGCNVPPGLAGVGTTTITCTGRGSGAAPPNPLYDAVIAGADTPSTIGLSMTTFAQSGVAFAIQTSKVQVIKQVLGTRANPTDSFDVFATSPEGSEVGRASTGSAGAANTGELTVLPRLDGGTYTLAEEGTPSSGTDLADYDQQWTCTNNSTPYTPAGSTTGTSVSVSPEAGDHIVCTVTNARIAPVTCTSDPNLFNTGYNAASGGILGNGAIDPRWQVAGPFYTPTGTSPPAQALPPPGTASFGNAVVGNQAPGSWAASPYGNAQWISQPGTGASNGDWYYRHSFVLDPAVNPADFSLRMNFLADNNVAEVYVNGVAQSGKTTGLPQNASAPYTYAGYTLPHAAQTTLDEDWQTGLNQIVVQIKSFGPAEGFIAQMVPSPVCEVDLAITKTALPDSYTPGQSLTYTVEVTNGGPGTASGLSVSDPLPAALAGAGFTWTCSATSGSSCQPSGSGNISDVPLGSYPGPSIAPGGELTYTVTGTVPAATSGTLTNTATVTPPAGTQDADCTPSCSATTATPRVPVSDLELTKSAEPTIVDPGQQVVYTLTATNNGPEDEPSASIVDALPAGVTYVSDDGGCDTSSLPQITCQLGAIADGATRSVHITVTADMSAADSSQRNTAEVSGQNLDLEPDNNDAFADVFVRPVADLEIEKTADPGTVNPNDPVTYTLVVTNNGPDASPSAVLTDTLPTGVTYVSDDGACETDLPDITCDVGAIPNGGSETIHIDVTVNGDAGGTVQTNSASVTGVRTDPDPDNNSSDADVLVLPLSDLSVTKTAPATVRAGQELTYTLAWANDGPTDSPSQTAITDTLPAGVTYVSDDGGCETGSLPQITCNLGAVADGASGTISIVVAVDPETRGEIQNTASIDGPNNDQNPDNDSDGATTDVQPQLTDLGIEKAADPDVVDPGGAVSYTLTVSNDGPDDSLSAQVTDTLPAGLRYESDDGGCDTSALPEITCEVGALANGDSATIHVETTVSLNAGGTVQDNDATVSTASGNDTNPDNDSATARILVTPISDLSVTKDVSAASIHAGHQLTYTLDYANAGPTTSDPTVVTDTLPAGVTYVSDDAECDVSALPEISCDVGSLAEGDSGSIEIVVSVGQATRGEIENTVTIDGPNEDQDSTNDSDQATTQVNAPVSDLSLAKTAPTGPFKLGDQISYQLTVVNAGPDAAPEVVVTDNVPAGLSYVSDDGDCDTSALPKVECDLGTLADGESRELRIVTRVDAVDGASVTNSATVSSANGDPDPADDGASAVAGLVAPAPVTKETKCFFGNTVTILGTNRPDRIVGTPGRDVINGRRGNDVILGLGGNDLICGGAGEDKILGGRGNDGVKGSAGDDLIHGNRGSDWLRGAPGDDTISGRQGADKLMGNRGNDRLRGRTGNDFLLGGPGTDWGAGGPGNDRGKSLETAFGVRLLR